MCVELRSTIIYDQFLYGSFSSYCSHFLKMDQICFCLRRTKTLSTYVYLCDAFRRFTAWFCACNLSVIFAIFFWYKLSVLFISSDKSLPKSGNGFSDKNSGRHTTAIEIKTGFIFEYCYRGIRHLYQERFPNLWCAGYVLRNPIHRFVETQLAYRILVQAFRPECPVWPAAWACNSWIGLMRSVLHLLPKHIHLRISSCKFSQLSSGERISL